MRQAWGLRDRVLALASGEPPTFPTLVDIAGWHLTFPPPAIDSYMGGVVVDGRLWFVARVTGVTADDVTWQLVSSPDGGSWESLGRSSGITRGGVVKDDLDPRVPFLGRVDGTWVAAVWLDGNVNEGITKQALRWSRDGVHWSDATLPAWQPQNEFILGAASEDVMVVVAEDGMLLSRDGMAWRRGTVPASLETPSDLACSDSLCVLAGRGIAADAPVAWSSEDGRTWTESETKLGGPDPSGLRHVVSTEAGFVGLQDQTNRVWASEDGMRWRSFDVIPGDLRPSIVELAAGGDLVVGLEAPFVEDAPPGSWLGSLSELFEG